MKNINHSTYYITSTYYPELESTGSKILQRNTRNVFYNYRRHGRINKFNRMMRRGHMSNTKSNYVQKTYITLYFILVFFRKSWTQFLATIPEHSESIQIMLSRVLVTETGFGLVIGFINHSHVVTTINCNTVPEFYTTKHSTLIFSFYLHCSSWIYHKEPCKCDYITRFQYHCTTVHIKSSNHK
jgi:hypothetical protein